MDADISLAMLTSLLDLEEFEVVEATWDRVARLRRFTLIPKTDVGLCPHCHQLSEDRHLCHDRTIMDLPMAGHRVELTVRMWQFNCLSCGKYFTPHFAALAHGAHATQRLLEQLAQLASHGDLSSAARFFQIPQKTAEGWYYAFIERKAQQSAKTYQAVRSLGIDELSLKKDTASSAAC